MLLGFFRLLFKYTGSDWDHDTQALYQQKVLITPNHVSFSTAFLCWRWVFAGCPTGFCGLYLNGASAGLCAR